MYIIYFHGKTYLIVSLIIMNIHEATIANPNTGLVGKNFIAVGREYHNYKVPDSVPEIEMRDPIRYNMAPASFLEVFKQDQAMYNKAFQGPLISALERNGRQDVLDTIRGLEEIPDDDPNDERDGSGLFEGDHVNPRYLRKLIYYNDYAIPYYSSNYPKGYDPQALVNAIDWDRGRGSGYLYAKPDGGSLLSSLGSYFFNSGEKSEKEKSNARVIIEGIGDAAVGTIKGVRKGIDLTRAGIEKGKDLYEKAKNLPKEYKRNKEIATDTKRITKGDTKKNLKKWWSDLWKSKDKKEKRRENTLSNLNEFIAKGKENFKRTQGDDEEVRKKMANPTYDDEAKMKLSVDKDYGKLYKRKEDSAEKIAQRHLATNSSLFSNYEDFQNAIKNAPKVSSDSIDEQRDGIANHLYGKDYDKLDKVQKRYIREAVKNQVAYGNDAINWTKQLERYIKNQKNGTTTAELSKATDPPAVPNPVIENSEILPKTPMVQTSMNPTDELPPDVEEPPAKEEEENDEYNSYVQPLMNGLSTLGNAASSVGTSAYNLFGGLKNALSNAYYGPPAEEKKEKGKGYNLNGRRRRRRKAPPSYYM